MKKELSFYEFVGVLIPSVILLFFAEMLFEYAYEFQVIDFSKVGETVIFLIVAYGVGHILHSLGNFLEWLLWKIYGGMPTNWLTKKTRFGQKLFDDFETKKILEKIYSEIGESAEKDYGRLIYTKLFSKGLTSRIDIFNANYSLFRGLTVAFILLGILSTSLLYWEYSLIPFFIAILSLARMIRFAKLYATETYRTYLISLENYDKPTF